jgi:hypothetical protein
MVFESAELVSCDKIIEWILFLHVFLIYVRDWIVIVRRGFFGSIRDRFLSVGSSHTNEEAGTGTTASNSLCHMAAE